MSDGELTAYARFGSTTRQPSPSKLAQYAEREARWAPAWHTQTSPSFRAHAQDTPAGTSIDPRISESVGERDEMQELRIEGEREREKATLEPSNLPGRPKRSKIQALFKQSYTLRERT